MAKRSRPLNEALLEGLTDPEEAAEYINAAYEDSERAFHKAILNVARAHKIAKIARTARVTREHLYRSLSGHGNPTEATLNAVLHSIGLQRTGVKQLASKKPAAPSSAVPSTKRRSFRARRATVSSNQMLLNFGSPGSRQLLAKIMQPINANTTSLGAFWQLATLPVPQRNPLEQDIPQASNWCPPVAASALRGWTEARP